MLLHVIYLNSVVYFHPPLTPIFFWVSVFFDMPTKSWQKPSKPAALWSVMNPG